MLVVIALCCSFLMVMPALEAFDAASSRADPNLYLKKCMKAHWDAVVAVFLAFWIVVLIAVAIVVTSGR